MRIRKYLHPIKATKRKKNLYFSIQKAVFFSCLHYMNGNQEVYWFSPTLQRPQGAALKFEIRISVGGPFSKNKAFL
jgi:hypothetical protein